MGDHQENCLAGNGSDGWLGRMALDALGRTYNTVICTDCEGIIHFWNAGAERLLGRHRSEMLGTSIFARHAPEVAAESRQLFSRILKGEDYRGPWQEISADGEIVTLDMHVFRHCDASGAAVGVIGLGRDRSEAVLKGNERLRVLARLSEARQLDALALMAMGCAHELNNHLTMISHCAELSELTGERNPPGAGWSEVRDLCRRALAVVQRMRSQQAQSSLRIQRGPLDEVLRRAVRSIRLALPSGVRIPQLPASDPVIAEFIPSAIEELVIHLVLAAGGALGEGGAVTVDVSPGAAAVQVRFATEPARLIPTWSAAARPDEPALFDDFSANVARIRQLVLCQRGRLLSNEDHALVLELGR